MIMKLLTTITASAVILLAAQSCNHIGLKDSDAGGEATVISDDVATDAPSGDADIDSELEPVFTSEESAELGRLSGALQGYDRRRQLDYLLSQVADSSVFDRNLYVKGVTLAVDTDPDNLSYVNGLNQGLALMMQLGMYKRAGIEIDRDILLSAIDEYLSKSEPLDPAERQMIMEIRSALNARALN